MIVVVPSAALMGINLTTRGNAFPILPALLVLHHHHLQHQALQRHLPLQGLHGPQRQPDRGHMDVQMDHGVALATTEGMLMTSPRHPVRVAGLVSRSIIRHSKFYSLIWTSSRVVAKSSPLWLVVQWLQYARHLGKSKSQSHIQYKLIPHDAKHYTRCFLAVTRLILRSRDAESVGLSNPLHQKGSGE